jgi:type VI secretion system protein ImpK
MPARTCRRRSSCIKKCSLTRTLSEIMMNQPPILQWSPADSAPASSDSLLLASFSAFYEEVASIKRCQREGTLAAYLARDNPDAALSGDDYAARASARLLLLLRQQHLAFQRKASAQQIKLHHTALYVMAALADEILLLELRWPGADHWLPVLLERQMFRTTHSGLLFFSLADKLIAGNSSDPLHADLSSVFLLALRLGFKGLHRTASGEKTLDQYRHRLFRIAGAGKNRLALYQPQPQQPVPRQPVSAFNRLASTGFEVQPALAGPPGFVQAYQHNIIDGKDLRLAPLSAWRHKLKAAALAYLLLSTVVWLVLVYPLAQWLKP